MPDFLSLFDDIRIISLAERADRRREVEKTFMEAGEPVDGQRIRYFIAERPTERGGFDSLGARGCFASHLEILKSAARAGSRRLLIVEDDAQFVRDFRGRAPGLGAELEAESWDIFYGGFNLDEPDQARIAGGVQRADPDMLILQTHCVAFSGRIIGEAAAYLEAMLGREPGDPAGGPMHVDGAYSWFRRSRPDIATFLVSPPVAVQRASKSDVYKEKLIDRLPVLKDAVRLTRRLKNRLS